MTRRLLTTATVALVALSLGAGSAAAAGPTATAALKTCSSPNSPKYPSSKGGYFTKLIVDGLSCADGKKVMMAHARCRLDNGLKGKCPSVKSYTCTQRAGEVSSTEYNARVTCKKGNRRVQYFFQQNL